MRALALAACAALALCGCAPKFTGAVPRDPDRGGGWLVVGEDARGTRRCGGASTSCTRPSCW